ncbi:MAG: fibronectin type III domain-containing protein, partial [Betaproteobacteria bacterium]|nr:fibronectin type III domain-containing protein [Betaproteobacteria bacterium]
TATNAQGTGAPSAPSNSVTLPNVPSAPVFLNGIVGDGQIVAVFQPSSSNGGSPITGYTVQCASNPLPTQTGTGGGSPITVTGMTNGAVYSCGVIASNAVGNSPPSNLLSLMPSDMAPLTLVSVQSRKTHGSAGNFDLAIDMQALIGGAITVEPRAIGAGHSLVFQFNNTITATGNASAVDAALATIGSTNVSAAGNEVTISLTGVPDNRRATISLTNVNGLSNSFSVSMGFLVGDVGSSRTVNGQDISAVKGRAGQVADASNFRFDLNASGAINASDIAAVRKRIGLSLP